MATKIKPRRVTAAGGSAELDAAGYDVLSRRPRVAKAKKLRMALVTGSRMLLGV